MAEVKKDTTYYGSYFPTRLYGVQDMNTFLEGVISDGVIVPYVTTVVINFEVQIVIGLAKALGVKSRRFTAETLDFTVDNPDATLNRIDSIFYRVDLATDKRDSLVYKPGTAATSPVAPDPDTSNPTLIKEIRLCNISVGGGVVNLVQGNIDETVQEISTVSILADNATSSDKAIADGDDNNIVATYAKKVNHLTYTYNEFEKIGLDNTDFGGNLTSSVNAIVLALNAENPTGSASIRSAISNSDLSNLVSDINTALNLSETSYRIEVENVRGEFLDAPQIGLPNRVIIIANSTGKIYMGTYDTGLTPDLTMNQLISKAQHNIETYDQFEQLDLSDSDFSPTDWETNLVKIIDKMLLVSPNNSSIFSVYFTSSGTNEFSNLLDSLDTELSKTSTGYALKVEILFNESSGIASKVSPTRITVVRNGDDSKYEGYYDSGNWFGFALSDNVSVGVAVVPGPNITMSEERIEKIGRMVIGTFHATFILTIDPGDIIFTITDDAFRPITDITIIAGTGGYGNVDCRMGSVFGTMTYNGTVSVTGSDAFRISFAYISN